MYIRIKIIDSGNEKLKQNRSHLHEMQDM